MAVDKKIKAAGFGPYLYVSADRAGIDITDLSGSSENKLLHDGMECSSWGTKELLMTDVNKKTVTYPPGTARIDLTDNTGGTGNSVLVAISGSGADTNINNNFADLVLKVNKILQALRDAKIILP
jgi:hypothetical protein